MTVGRLPLFRREPEPESTDARDGTDHVLLLRRELAESEVTELREALAEAVLIEHEAIARAGAIRARLREAESNLAELGGGMDDAPDPE